MTAIEGTWMIVHQDSQGQDMRAIMGPVEARNFRVSATDPYQQIWVSSGNQIVRDNGVLVSKGMYRPIPGQEHGDFQAEFSDDTASAASENGRVFLDVSDPTAGGNRRRVWQGENLVSRMPGGTIAELLDGGTLTGYPGDPRAHVKLPFGYPGLLQEGSKIFCGIRANAADTIESEESWLKLRITYYDRRGFSRPAILGILDGVNDDLQGIPAFGLRGNTETGDDVVLAASQESDVWLHVIPTGVSARIGWGGAISTPVLQPGERLAFKFNPDASPTGTTYESEDAWDMRVPVTLVPLSNPNKPVLTYLKNSNTAAQDDFNFSGTVDRPAYGGQYTLVNYYQVPLNTLAILGHPGRGAPMYLFPDKA